MLKNSLLILFSLLFLSGCIVGNGSDRGTKSPCVQLLSNFLNL